MRKQLFLLVVGILFCSIPLLAQDGSKEQILTTAHDLVANAATYGITMTGTNAPQVCAYCHIPHADMSNQSPAQTLLWNHVIPATTTYKVYSSPSLKATPTMLNTGNAVQLGSEAFYSLACLSCHDGQTAINAVYRTPDNTVLGGSVTMGAIPGDGVMHLVGQGVGPLGDLSQSHPVNFTYDAALVAADTGIWDVGTAANIRTLGTSAIKAVRPTNTLDAFGALQQPLLFNNTVQCASCHNPHNDGNPDYLRTPIVNSQLCFKCHSTSPSYN
jgi:predicted CXXCH cytochrome family protein